MARRLRCGEAVPAFALHLAAVAWHVVRRGEPLRRARHAALLHP